MNQYVTGEAIRANREKKNLTQAALADCLGVSDKTISKWETGRGFPDITMLESLADALGLSVIELLSGQEISNANRAGNVLKSKFYVCPVCGNIIHSMGDTLVSCCGITLPPLEAEEPDEAHKLEVELVEDEYFVTMNHEMSKLHYISFIACITNDGVKIVKLYPEGNPEARVPRRGAKFVYFYCNKHGFFKQMLKKPVK